MREADADTRAETPSRTQTTHRGTVGGSSTARQARTAREDTGGNEARTLIEQVVRRENLVAAHARVVRNGGAPGVDGMSVDDLMPYCRQHWARIREQLLTGTYIPQPVRCVDIPKPDGKGTRTLGIPTVLDRFIQQALLQVLSPIFDPTFSDGSFGFRPGRNTHQAVRCARGHIAAGHRWVVDMDLEKFFDRVNHDVLMARVARRVKDKRVLLLIRRYLQAGMMADGLVSPRTEGTPQGGPLSPLLSNILLDEWDRELERRGHRFARYADDCNVYVRSHAAGERVMASLERFLTTRLRLRMNREKSCVARPWKRKFLGYSVTADRPARLRVAPAAVKRLKTKLRDVLAHGRGRRLADTVKDLNLATRGWVMYFRLAEAKASFEDLDKWLRRKLRCIVWRQWKRPRTRYRELRRHGLAEARARASAFNGHGPWWNAGASHLHAAVPTAVLRQLGLLSLLDEHQRLARAS
jgi:RNA-directed DNA polymerase